jgi:hypothetical protein
MRRFLLAGSAAAAVVVLGMTATPTPAQAGVCPATGNDTTCGAIININSLGPGGITVTFTGQGPYDGSDDTLIGIVNHTNSAISTIHITGPGGTGSGSGITGFDGDGVASAAFLNIASSPSTSGYGGRDSATGNFDLTGAFVTYSNIVHGGIGGTDSLDVGLGIGGVGSCIQGGGSAFFSLETHITSASGATAGGVVACPEPTSLAILGVAFGGFTLMRRRRKA